MYKKILFTTFCLLSAFSMSCQSRHETSSTSFEEKIPRADEEEDDIVELGQAKSPRPRVVHIPRKR